MLLGKQWKQGGQDQLRHRGQTCWLVLGGSSGGTHSPQPVTVRHASGRVLRIRGSAECQWSSAPRGVHLLSSQGGCFRVLLAYQEALLVCRRLFSILRSQIQVVSLGGGNKDGINTHRPKNGVSLFYLKTVLHYHLQRQRQRSSFA